MANEEEDELEYSDIDADTETADPDVFHVGDLLEVPTTHEYTTRELHDAVMDGDIDLNPAYQREVVWTDDKKTMLLDSIFRNFYVPPILFVVTQDDEGQNVKKCMDGKQRLTSIIQFFGGLIPYKDPRTHKQWYWTQTDRHRNVVPDEWKRKFESKKISCTEYTELSPVYERDVFQRVQLGVPLQPAEKLQAISSLRADWITELHHTYLTRRGAEDLVKYGEGIADTIDVQLKRAQAFQMIAQMAFFADGVEMQKSYSVAKLGAWLKGDEPLLEDYKDQIESVLEKFKELCMSQAFSYGFSRIAKRVAPIEFVFIGIIIYLLNDISDDSEIAEEIYNMRLFIRNAFPDAIRNRPDIVKKLWEFIVSMSKRQRCGIQWGPATATKKTKAASKRKTPRGMGNGQESGKRRKTKG
ncbi:hypothetical protein EUX98_g1899 [Antrodiella citrinella]|uniref:GmrSD restriction endonucleases N-terminal domain-containing protein n=1 Tax=Antrodiella citrinella TaxID=2447956 RepID=A0A4S4N0B7_9APHY|nr:hypothetical protein EUX98_g1899 [Antrodiella citrinella]